MNDCKVTKMLPRPVSIFDDNFPEHLPESASIGAPPPLGAGSGQLYIVVPKLLIGGKDLGPAIFLIKEHRPKDAKTHNTWGPPGGETDKTDHSPLHAALREFGEEVGADWRMLANASPAFQLVRLRKMPRTNESWAMIVNLEAQQAENALFGEDRSKWTLNKRMNTSLSNEVGGYAFVPIKAILAADPKTGTFAIGANKVNLRIVSYTLDAVKKIAAM